MNHLGRALLEYTDPPVKMLFVYNCNPLATMPDQNRVLRGLQRDDLFTVVFDQVFTDTAGYADVMLPSTTFLENYDIAKAYGPIGLQLVRPVIEPVGESRPNAEVFSELAARLGVGEAERRDRHACCGSPAGCRSGGSGADGARIRHAAIQRRPGAVRRRVTPDAGREGPPLPGRARPASAPRAFTVSSPIRPPNAIPLALISPASEKTVSSTLGELRERSAFLQMHPSDAAARGLSQDDPVRVFNDLGEVHVPVGLNRDIRPGTVSLPKGLWRKSTVQRLDFERARPGQPDRPRWRRLFQRREGRSGAVRGDTEIPLVVSRRLREPTELSS